LDFTQRIDNAFFSDAFHDFPFAKKVLTYRVYDVNSGSKH